MFKTVRTLTEISIVAIIVLRNRPLNDTIWTDRSRHSIEFLFTLNKFNLPWWQIRVQMWTRCLCRTWCWHGSISFTSIFLMLFFGFSILFLILVDANIKLRFNIYWNIYNCWHIHWLICREYTISFTTPFTHTYFEYFFFQNWYRFVRKHSHTHAYTATNMILFLYR